MDDVGPLVAPIANHAFPAELSQHHLLIAALTARPVLQLTDLLQTRSGAHELEDGVDGQSAAKLGLEGRGFEARHDHEVGARQVNLLREIKEARRPADLLQTCLSEGLVDDQVEDHLLHVVIFVGKFIIEKETLSSLLGDLDRDFVAPEVDSEFDRLSQLLQNQNSLARWDEWPDRRLDLLPFGSEDAQHFVCLPKLIWGHLKRVLKDCQRAFEAQLVQV